MFWQQIVNGCAIGSIYAMITIGFSLIFAILRMINFANGTIFILGAYLTLMVFQFVPNIWFAILISMLLNGAISFCLDWFLLQALRKRKAPTISPMLVTMGLSIVIENSIQTFYGSDAKPIPYAPELGQIMLGSVRISGFQLVIFGVAVVMVVVLSVCFYKTKLGCAVQATAQNLTATDLMGINTSVIIACTFMLSAFLSTISGTMVSMYYKTVNTTMANSIGLKVFGAAVLGGIGSVPGSIVGGMLIGIFETLCAGYISAGYKDAVPFAILIIVLLVKPSGMFGKKEIVKV